MGIDTNDGTGRTGRRSLRLIVWGIFFVTVLAMFLSPTSWIGYERRTDVGKLFNSEPDFVWIPNDVYGHVHDELWNLLVLKMAATDGEAWDSFKQMDRARSWHLTEPVIQIDSKAVPELVALMSSSNLTAGESLRRSVAGHFTGRIHEWIYPFDVSMWGDPATRRHIAAFRGFTALGTNAEPALPALSNLLASGTCDFPLTWAIANIGQQGMALLTNTLSAADPNVRELAALALGLQGRRGTPAIPALMECVRRGQARYQVLGALGRLGCDDPALAPLLVRELKREQALESPASDDSMAFLVLGLMGERARDAAPLVEAKYREAMKDPGAISARRFYRRILAAIAPDQAGKLPPPRDADELSVSWP